MKVVYSIKHQLHDPESYFTMGRIDKYPETASRANSVYQAILERKIGPVQSPNDFGREPILSIHSANYLNYIENAYESWVKTGGNPNGVLPDTFAARLDSVYVDISSQSGNLFKQMGLFTFDTAAVIVKDTFNAAYEAAQVALTGASLILEGSNCAFALCRPPGHHSGESLAGGFCFFNNAAIATQYLISQTKSKVAILDVDYHHGNGTQTIFYNRKNPLVVSLHGKDDYPFFWGHEEERGAGEGLGFNINRPLESGTEDEDYLKVLTKVIKDEIIPYEPSYLVVSLGVDTFVGDPVGKFALTSDCFTKIGQLIKTISVPTLFVMEGGYAVQELGDNICNVLAGYEI